MVTPKALSSPRSTHSCSLSPHDSSRLYSTQGSSGLVTPGWLSPERTCGLFLYFLWGSLPCKSSAVEFEVMSWIQWTAWDWVLHNDSKTRRMWNGTEKIKVRGGWCGIAGMECVELGWLEKQRWNWLIWMEWFGIKWNDDLGFAYDSGKQMEWQ